MLHDQMKSIKVLNRVTVLAVILLFIIGSVVEKGWALRLRQVVVPLYKLAGEDAKLLCPFELENDRLYAVKWYKDNEEFFRYVPKYNPPMYEHKVEGISVLLRGSDSKQVSLHKLDLRSTGVYKCEVSAEGPSFASVHGEGRMTVVHLPSESPQISGTVFEEYSEGDTLELNCTTGASFPAAKISWYLGDNPIQTNYIKTISPSHSPHSLPNVTRSVSELRMPLEAGHLESGTAKVRCVASIFAVVHQDGHETIVGNARTGVDLRSTSSLRAIDDREALILVRGGSSINGENPLVLFLSIVISLTFFPLNLR